MIKANKNTLGFIIFRVKKLLWNKLYKAHLIHKRPLFDGGVYIKPFMERKY